MKCNELVRMLNEGIELVNNTLNTGGLSEESKYFSEGYKAACEAVLKFVEECGNENCTNNS